MEGRGGEKEGEVVATKSTSRAEGEVVATTRKSRAVPGIKTGRRPQRPSKMESPADNKEEEEEGGDEEEEEEEEEEKKKGWFVCDEPDCGHKVSFECSRVTLVRRPQLTPLAPASVRAQNRHGETHGDSAYRCPPSFPLPLSILRVQVEGFGRLQKALHLQAQDSGERVRREVC